MRRFWLSAVLGLALVGWTPAEPTRPGTSSPCWISRDGIVRRYYVDDAAGCCSYMSIVFVRGEPVAILHWYTPTDPLTRATFLISGITVYDETTAEEMIAKIAARAEPDGATGWGDH